MTNLPTEEGEYLFYFGNEKNPYYAVDTFRFTASDEPEGYLENGTLWLVTEWWHLPKPHRFPDEDGKTLKSCAARFENITPPLGEFPK